METEKLIAALRYCNAVVNDTVNTGSCNFCPYRDHCSDLGNEAADLIESLQAQLSAKEAINQAYSATVSLLETDKAELVEQLSVSQARERAAVEELQILHEWLGGELPKRCDECELWGKGGWSQYGIGYCEGDYHPHKGTDFCNRWRGPQEAGEGERDG